MYTYIQVYRYKGVQVYNIQVYRYTGICAGVEVCCYMYIDVQVLHILQIVHV